MKTSILIFVVLLVSCSSVPKRETSILETQRQAHLYDCPADATSKTVFGGENARLCTAIVKAKEAKAKLDAAQTEYNQAEQELKEVTR